MFGEEYIEVAKRKYDLEEGYKKGELAEYLAVEFLRLRGIKSEDVRKKCVLVGTLRRPDFIIDDKFVEVKSGYLTMDGFGKMKGYKKIVSDYMWEKIKSTGRILNGGIIISMDGFSPKIRKQARKDEIELVGPEELKYVFEEGIRTDLVKLLRKLRGLKSPYPALPFDLKSATTLSNVSGSNFSSSLNLKNLGNRRAYPEL